MSKGKRIIGFIHVNGRAVPIRDDGGGKAMTYKKEASKAILYSSKQDKKLADQGFRLSKGFGALGVAGLSSRIFGKGIARNLGTAAAAVGVFGSFLNDSFARGRIMSSRDSLKYADAIKKGKSIRRGTGIGGASDRAYREAKFLYNMSKSTPKKKSR